MALSSPYLCRVIIAALLLAISIKPGFPSFGYECRKANVTHNSILSQAITNPNKPIPAFKFWRYFSHHLMQNEVVYNHGVINNDTKNHIYVRIGQDTYTVICPPETVTILHNDICYANGIMQIITQERQIKYLDANNFITDIATPVPCQPQAKSIKTQVLQKITDFHILKQGSEAIAYAQHKKNQLFDITKLLNQESAKKLIWIEEKALCNGSLLSSLQFHYRKHGMKISIAILSVRAGLEITLFLAGLAYGLPLVKSLSLASSMVKRCVDFRSYLAQKRLTQEEEVRKLHRKQLGREANQDLSQVTSSHLSCIYSALLDVTDRVSEIEQILNVLARSPTITPMPTPSPRRVRSVGHTSRGSISSHSSTATTAAHRNVRNQGRKNTKSATRAVAFSPHD